MTFASVLMTVGYLTYQMEQAHHGRLRERKRSAHAEQQRLAAHEHANELRHAIEQRDAMIMAASSYSTLYGLVMHNATIVQELSQPVQALASIVDRLKRPEPLDAPLREELGQALETFSRMSAMLVSLRNLVAAPESVTGPVNLASALQDLAPIMRNEASRRGLQFGWIRNTGDALWRARANRAQLERIILALNAAAPLAA